MASETEISLARSKLAEESMKANVAFAAVVECRENLAEAESAWRAQRAKVAKMIETIQGMEFGF